MKKLLTIASKGEGYTADFVDREDGSFSFLGDWDNDWDGSKRWKEDKWGQADTTLHHNGKPIDSWAVPGIVVPPEIIKAVTGVVLGCYAEVTYKGKTEPAVVFDVGPKQKLGEGSPCLAVRLSINPSHAIGMDEQSVLYRIWPGRPAIVDGITYKLQPYRY